MKPGSPQPTSRVFIVFTSTFLLVAISSRYLFQSAKLSRGAFLKIHDLHCVNEVKKITNFETFLKAMPVSVVDMAPLPGPITPACLNHLSDCRERFVGRNFKHFLVHYMKQIRMIGTSSSKYFQSDDNPWVSLMVAPSALLSPNLAKSTNLVLSSAASAMSAVSVWREIEI